MEARSSTGCWTDHAKADGARLASCTTIEAEVDDQGNIRPREPVVLAPGSRVLITVLEPAGAETARLSEAALAADWQPRDRGST